ncbi:MAG: hypothetical protein EBX95_14495 [Acidimicrobiia bacterium]|nr:hypothetical protein [Acidimicrobiia bacterium]
MNTGVFLPLFIALPLLARDYTLTVVDEAKRPLQDVAVSALFSRANDPRLGSMRSFEGKTDGQGVFRFQAGDEMCLDRLRAAKQGYLDADVTELHGLGKVPSDLSHLITLPRETNGVPLCYKEVQLRTLDGTLPRKTWVGFDFAVGDVVAPWGRGQTADIRFWNEGEQVGWTETAETVERFRKDKDHARFSEDEFIGMYGSFRGVTKVGCVQPGDGIMRSPAFWPYCELKMPALAPAEGYVTSLEIPYATLPYPSYQDDYIGYYLRVRTKVGPDGKVVTAQYAKIQGAIWCGYGAIRFRYYYNPVADDRRLVMDKKRNLLQPPPGTPGSERVRYIPYER